MPFPKNEGMTGQIRPQYDHALAPLFTDLHRVSAFEYASTLVRVGGMADAGWDAVEESSEFLEDLSALTQPGSQLAGVRDPEKTRWRLRLVSYAHVTEMDAPYELLANLFRLRLGMRYSSIPFQIPARGDGGNGKRSKKQKPGAVQSAPPPSPSQKIDSIKELAKAAGFPKVGDAFGEFYFAALRNAIDHSDYVLHQNELRLLKGFLPTARGGASLSPVVPFDRLEDFFARATAFYRTLFDLAYRTRAGFADLKGECFRGEFFPGQTALKGLLEFLIDGHGLLCGWKIHWPNQLDSTYRRTAIGREAVNMFNTPDGAVEFMPGEYFAEHDSFSPLIPRGTSPRYTLSEGVSRPPTWDDAPNCVAVRAVE